MQLLGRHCDYEGTEKKNFTSYKFENLRKWNTKNR